MERRLAQERRQAKLAGGVATAAALVLIVLMLTSPALRHGQRAVLDSTAGLPVGWHKDMDASGRTYYWNRRLGTSSWDRPREGQQMVASKLTARQPRHYLRPAAADPQEEPAELLKPLPITRSPRDALSATPSGAPGWDQMAIPLDKLGQARRQSGAQDKPRILQALAPDVGSADKDKEEYASAEEENDATAGGMDEADEPEEGWGDASGNADWPHELPGAAGDDTSWIVGMHREPFWSDSMTHACGLTDPCPTGRADRGHRMQTETNPYVDKRRTFNPYAQGDAYQDPEGLHDSSAGRKAYPWDPTRDPQFYGKEGVDCSDGVLRDECYQEPEDKDLQRQQAVWRKNFDEFARPSADEVGQHTAAGAAKTHMKDDGLNGALLHMPKITDSTPWANSMSKGLVTGMLHGSMISSSNVKAISKEAAADAARKFRDGHDVGGEPVVASLAKVEHKIRAAYKQGFAYFSGKNMKEIERRFLRASSRPQQRLLTRHQALRGFDSTVLRPEKSTTTALAGVEAPRAYGQAATHTGKRSDTSSIWESPAQVAAHGVFGSAQASDSAKQGAVKRRHAAATKKRAAAAKKLVSVDSQVQDEAIKVVRAAAKGAENLIDKVTGKAQPTPDQESNIQKGVLRKESTESNLMRMVKERDDRLIQESSGLSPTQLKAAVAAAERDSNKTNKGKKAQTQVGGKVGGELEPWEAKVEQQGTLRHETVEQNLKSALKAREKMLWQERTGWKSVKDMQQAEAFADNLEREIDQRRKEEASHPLMPKTAESLLDNEASRGAAGLGSGSSTGSHRGKAYAEEVVSKAREAREQRELNRLREGEPLVKALQSEVDNDEMELTSEAEQEQATLRQLHRDQVKLNHQLAVEESIAPATDKATRGHAVRRNSKEAGGGHRLDSSGTPGAIVTTSVTETRHAVPPLHGISRARAQDDLDEYFAKQQQQQQQIRRSIHHAAGEKT